MAIKDTGRFGAPPAPTGQQTDSLAFDAMNNAVGPEFNLTQASPYSGAHTALALGGFLPTPIGTALDAVDMVLYLSEGDLTGAGMAAVSTLPLGSFLMKGAKVAKKPVNSLSEIADLREWADVTGKSYGQVEKVGRKIGPEATKELMNIATTNLRKAELIINEAVSAGIKKSDATNMAIFSEYMGNLEQLASGKAVYSRTNTLDINKILEGIPKGKHEQYKHFYAQSIIDGSEFSKKILGADAFPLDIDRLVREFELDPGKLKLPKVPAAGGGTPPMPSRLPVPSQIRELPADINNYIRSTPSRAVTPTNVQGADVFQNLIRGLRVARSSQGEFETGSPTDATNVLTQYDRMRNFEKLPGAFDFRPTLSKRDTVDPVRPPFRPKKIVK